LRIARRYRARPRAGKTLAGRVIVGSVIAEVVTARMRSEPIGPQHLDVVAPIFADPRVAATMGGVQTREQVLEILERQAGAWERDGFGYWMCFERSTGAPFARGGVQRTVFDGGEEVEVGWTTAPDRWGEGFATELGAAALDAAFGELGLADVVAFTLPQNGASRRVMEKLGFTYEKTAPYREYGDHVLYRRRCEPTGSGASP
jgi:RimJ/RimL family protein N-acetyltransferase